MLKSVDVLLGLSVVMLIVSMAVTLLSQAMLNVLASRGRNLRDGLADLLELLDARMSRRDAEAIAGKTLSQRIIGGRFRCWLPRRLRFFQFGEVIHREEFVKILLGLAAAFDTSIKTEFERINSELANEAITVNVALAALENKLRDYPVFFKSLELDCLIAKVKTETGVNKQKRLYQKLRKIVGKHIDLAEKLSLALRENGIENPENTLKNVRMLALQLEKSNPELAHDVREANALMQEAASDFLAKVHLNFDHLIDRVAVRFTATTRVVSVLSAALVAIVLQLDTLNIINRLSMDEQMRAAFVELAPKFAQDAELKSKLGEAKPALKTSQNAGAAQENNTDETKETKQSAELETEKYYLKLLADQGLITLAKDFKTWCENWDSVSTPGVILSIFLLSLGGPFWYNALSKLLQLRSIVARKDDEQKTIRQTTQVVGGSGQSNPDTPTASNPLQGERGDLKALG